MPHPVLKALPGRWHVEKLEVSHLRHFLSSPVSAYTTTFCLTTYPTPPIARTPPGIKQILRLGDEICPVLVLGFSKGQSIS